MEDVHLFAIWCESAWVCCRMVSKMRPPLHDGAEGVLYSGGHGPAMSHLYIHCVFHFGSMMTTVADEEVFTYLTEHSLAAHKMLPANVWAFIIRLDVLLTGAEVSWGFYFPFWRFVLSGLTANLGLDQNDFSWWSFQKFIKWINDL